MARGALKIEQPLLAHQAARVARERAIGPDNAVAGPHNGERVLAIGSPHGAHRFGVIQLLGNIEVRGGAAVANAREVRLSTGATDGLDGSTAGLLTRLLAK